MVLYTPYKSFVLVTKCSKWLVWYTSNTKRKVTTHLPLIAVKWLYWGDFSYWALTDKNKSAHVYNAIHIVQSLAGWSTASCMYHQDIQVIPEWWPKSVFESPQLGVMCWTCVLVLALHWGTGLIPTSFAAIPLGKRLTVHNLKVFLDGTLNRRSCSCVHVTLLIGKYSILLFVFVTVDVTVVHNTHTRKGNLKKNNRNVYPWKQFVATEVCWNTSFEKWWLQWME